MCGAISLGYMLRLETGPWLMTIGIINVPFFAMEMRHMYNKELVC
jgi:hypothetical protein